MVAEVEGLHQAEKLVENYLRNMSASERKDEISYYLERRTKNVWIIAGQLMAFQ